VPSLGVRRRPSVNLFKNLLLQWTNLNKTWPQSSSGCLVVSDVPANQPTWQPLLKVEYRGKINKKIQLKKSWKIMWRCNCFLTSLKWYICDPLLELWFMTWTATIIKKKKIWQKFQLKNPEKGQLLSDVRKMIHFWLPFRIMVDNFSHHQTWLPLLLKIEHLIKKNAKM
jgi:hypothetical protein